MGQVQPFPRTPCPAPLARANPNPCWSAPDTPAHTQDSDPEARGRARPGGSRAGLGAPSAVPGASALVLEATRCGSPAGECSWPLWRHTPLALKAEAALLPAWGSALGTEVPPRSRGGQEALTGCRCLHVTGEQECCGQTGQKGVPGRRNMTHEQCPERHRPAGAGVSQVGWARAPYHQSRATAELAAKPSGLVRLRLRTVACSKAVTQFQ